MTATARTINSANAVMTRPGERQQSVERQQVVFDTNDDNDWVWERTNYHQHTVPDMFASGHEMVEAFWALSAGSLVRELRAPNQFQGATQHISPPARTDRWERALLELSDMQDGCAPAQAAILRVVERLLPVIRLHAKIPSFEVDEDDGTLTMRWKETGVPRSFALAFVRSSSFVAVLAEPGLGAGFSVAVRADDEAALVKLLETDRVARLIK
jgi:hypothetical protein